LGNATLKPRLYPQVREYQVLVRSATIPPLNNLERALDNTTPALANSRVSSQL